jgi:hypothetical protein
MLDGCASGWSSKLKEHHIWILWNGRTYRAMPKGRGRSEYTDHDIKIQHVRQMLTYLGIDEACARTALPQLGPSKQQAPEN